VLTFIYCETLANIGLVYDVLTFIYCVALVNIGLVYDMC